MLAKCQLIGRITKKPELKVGKSGAEFCNFSLAAENSKREQTSFYNCVCFGDNAKFVTTYLDKGSKVHIDGRMCIEKWEDKDGVKRESLKITASSVLALESKAESNSKQETYTNDITNQTYQTTNTHQVKPSELDLTDIPF
jgi:single-strand DNA-binding protein